MKLTNELKMTRNFSNGRVQIFEIDYSEKTGLYYVSIDGIILNRSTTFDHAIELLKKYRKTDQRRLDIIMCHIRGYQIER